MRELHANCIPHVVKHIVESDSQFHGLTVGSIIIASPETLVGASIDLLVITADREKEAILEAAASLLGSHVRVIIAGTAHLDFQDELFAQVCADLFVSSRAAGYPHMLIHVYQSLRYIVDRGLTGSIVEFGVYKAGTTLFIAKLLERLGRPTRIIAFDTFGGFPGRRSLLDLYNDSHDVYRGFDDIRAQCERYGIELVRGDICETYKRIENIPLVFSFFDTDNFSPTRAAIETCYRQTVAGGVLAFDHYYCDERWLYTIGERIAAKQFLKDKKVFQLHGTGIFIKY
jgi:O-methyltransferase